MKKLLWIDDEIEFLQSHIIFLTSKGFTVKTANNGYDGIEFVKRNNFDLILLDENMPGIDGLVTLSEIKDLRPDSTVVMVTKNEEENIMEDAMGRNIDSYLLKPVSPVQIISVYKTLVDRNRIVESKITDNYMIDYAKSMSLINSEPEWEDWFRIFDRIVKWDIEYSIMADKDLLDTHNGFKKECNINFSSYIKRLYPNWLKNPSNAPVLSKDIVKKYIKPLLENNEKVFFIIIDCMRLDQWVVIEKLLSEFYNIERNLYLSLIPTATAYSRNAIFSGLLPNELNKIYPSLVTDSENETSLNRYERQLLGLQLKELGFKLKDDPKYIKFLDMESSSQFVHQIDSYEDEPIVSLIFNFIDNLAHSRSESEILKEIAPDESAFRELTTSWFLHSSLFETLKILAKKGRKVVITTDHGSMLCSHGATIQGGRDLSKSLRYKYGDNITCDKRRALLIDKPNEFGLPTKTMNTKYAIAQEDYYFVFKNKYKENLENYRNTFQHGGISMEEMILPISIMTPREF